MKSDYDPWLPFRGSVKGNRFSVTRTPIGANFNPLCFCGVIESDGSGTRLKLRLSYPYLWISLILYLLTSLLALYLFHWNFRNPVFVKGFVIASVATYALAMAGYWWALTVQRQELLRIFHGLGAKLSSSQGEVAGT